VIQLVITVIGIALAALLVIGGANYIHGDLGTRIVVQRTLDTQRDAILTAVAAYRASNSGLEPAQGVIDEAHPIAGFLPEGRVPSFTSTMTGLRWNNLNSPTGLCLDYTGDTPVDDGVLNGILRFARSHAERNPGTVSLGADCEDEGTTDPSEMTPAFFGTPANSLAVRFRTM